MRKYFLYQLKKNLLPLACLTLFCVVMYVLPIASTSYDWWNNLGTTSAYHRDPNLYYSSITVALAIMSIFIPIAMFAYKMNKRSVDMHYSLPIAKTKILAVNFLVGLILMYASYTIAYILGFILIAIKVRRLYLIYYLYLYLASLIPAFITYAVTSFIFTRANTIIDGIISVAGSSCILALAAAAIFEFLPREIVLWADGIYFFPFEPLSQAATILGKAIIDGRCNKWLLTYAGSFGYNADICRLVSSILWLLLAIAATVGLFISEKNCKAENCNQITESPFCYKVQIPAYMVMFTFFVGDEFLALCAIAFAIFVFSIIYKRSIKIGRGFCLVLIASMLVGILLMAIKRVWVFGIVVLSLLIVGVIVRAVVLRIETVESR